MAKSIEELRQAVRNAADVFNLRQAELEASVGCDDMTHSFLACRRMYALRTYDAARFAVTRALRENDWSELVNSFTD